MFPRKIMAYSAVKWDYRICKGGFFRLKNISAKLGHMENVRFDVTILCCLHKICKFLFRQLLLNDLIVWPI